MSRSPVSTNNQWRVRMKVRDFDVDFSSPGLLTCCLDDVMNNSSEAKEGMVIECQDCGAKMILQNRGGTLKWCAYEE